MSPEVDGWTLVVGPWCDPCDSTRSEEVLRLCGELSARYGRAQAYYYGMQGDGSAWLVAERGTVLRRYSETGEGEDALLILGEPLPFERARRKELGLSPTWDEATESEDDQDEWKWAAFDLAPEIARSGRQSAHADGRHRGAWHRGSRDHERCCGGPRGRRRSTRATLRS